MATLIRTISFADTSIESIMEREVKTALTTKPLVESVKMMKECDIGSLVVVSDMGKPVGIFTERDLIKKIAEKLENLGMSIGQVMSKPLITIAPTASVWDALILMAAHDIRRIPVMQGRKLVGIVTERDIFRLILSQQEGLLSLKESIPSDGLEKR
jgi:CBS domain-containing protein